MPKPGVCAPALITFKESKTVMAFGLDGLFVRANGDDDDDHHGHATVSELSSHDDDDDDDDHHH